MTRFPTSIPGPVSAVQPHRGVLILVFGILSWVVCFIFGIVAWVMANNDLEQMQAGLMDPSGEGLTQAGRIVGMINVILSIVITVFVVGMMMIVAVGSSV